MEQPRWVLRAATVLPQMCTDATGKSHELSTSPTGIIPPTAMAIFAKISENVLILRPLRLQPSTFLNRQIQDRCATHDCAPFPSQIRMASTCILKQATASPTMRREQITMSPVVPKVATKTSRNHSGIATVPSRANKCFYCPDSSRTKLVLGLLSVAPPKLVWMSKLAPDRGLLWLGRITNP